MFSGNNTRHKCKPNRETDKQTDRQTDRERTVTEGMTLYSRLHVDTTIALISIQPPNTAAFSSRNSFYIASTITVCPNIFNAKLKMKMMI